MPLARRKQCGRHATTLRNYGWPSAIGTVPEAQSAPGTPDTSWAHMTVPAGMANCLKGAAVTLDGTHHVIMSGDWNAGIRRFIGQ